MNWEAMLVCGAKRAMGNSSDDRLLDDSAAGRSPWVHGWADMLDIVNSHAQVPAPPTPTRYLGVGSQRTDSHSSVMAG